MHDTRARAVDARRRRSFDCCVPDSKNASDRVPVKRAFYTRSHSARASVTTTVDERQVKPVQFDEAQDVTYLATLKGFD